MALFNISSVVALKVSRLLYVTGVVLLLIFILPTAWFPIQEGKLAVFTLCLLLSAIAFVVSGTVRSRMLVNGYQLLLLAFLLPAAYAVSWCFSSDRHIGLVGYSLDVDTVLFSILAYITFLLGYCLFKTRRDLILFLSVTATSLVVAAVFQLFIVSFGYYLPLLDIFDNRSSNLVGKWNDLGIIVGLLVVWLMLHLHWTQYPLKRHGVSLALLVCCMLLAALVQFQAVWILILVSCGLLAIFEYFTVSAGHNMRKHYSNIPILPAIVAAVSVFFICFGTQVSTVLFKVFPVSSIEVRPSIPTTLEVIRQSHGSLLEMFLGTGPNTFLHNWVMHKPFSVTQTQFWSLDFTVGYSNWLTVLSGEGIVGALAWLVLPILLVIFFQRVSSSSLAQEEKRELTFLWFGAVYLLTVALVYVSSPTVMLLVFVFSGVFFGVFYTSTSEEKHVSEKHSAVVLGVLLTAVATVCALVVSLIMLAAVANNKALIALQGNDITEAANQAQNMSNILSVGFLNTRNSDAKRLQAQIAFVELTQIASTPEPSMEVSRRFESVSESAIGYLRDAITLYPNDYRSYLIQGELYTLFTSLKIPNAQDAARLSYKSAARLNPTNPSIPLAQARLEALVGDYNAMKAYVDQSLSIKNNYTEAILFMVQVHIAQKDLPAAISAAHTALNTAPTQPVLWFELGLLFYASNDMDSAITALEKAIEFQPDYANAKYFLGLSYYAQGHTVKAVKLFAELVAQNPNNNEVRSILANMRIGMPVSSVEPASLSPEKRADAPINE